MNRKTISNYNLIAFMFFSNIVYFATIGFDYLIKHQRQNIYLGVIVMFLISFLLLLLWKNFPKKYNLLKDIRKDYLFRIITIIYIFINSCLMTAFSSFVSKKYFYELESMYIFFIFFIVLGLIIGCQNIKSIISISSIIFSLLLILYLVPIFNDVERNFLYLLPLNFDFSLLNAFWLVFLPLDNVLLVFYKNQFKDNFTAKTVFISNLIFMLYALYIVIDAVTLLGANFLSDISFSSFYRWKMFTSKNFILSDSIIILSLICSATSFRLGFNINLSRLLLFQKKKIRYFLIMGVLLFLGISLIYNFYHFIMKYLNILLIILSVLILLIYLFIVYKARRAYGKYLLENN